MKHHYHNNYTGCYGNTGSQPGYSYYNTYAWSMYDLQPLIVNKKKHLYFPLFFFSLSFILIFFIKLI